MFLKIFCFSRLTHNTPGISSVAYVSLLDNFNNPVLQVKVRITGLSGSGYFYPSGLFKNGKLFNSNMYSLDAELFAGALILTRLSV